MDEYDIKLRRAIAQAAAIVRLEGLPLSDKYINNYYENHKEKGINQNGCTRKLVLKRGNRRGK